MSAVLSMSPNDPGPAKSGLQRDQAYAELRRLLVLQQIGAGTKLRETEWSARLGVNRMALREALVQLEGEGLVERGAKVGYVVPTLSAEDIREILEARCCLECGAIDRIVMRDPMPSLQPLAEAVDRLDQLVREGYLMAVTETDRRFHETLIDLAGNPRLSALYQRAPLPMVHDPLIGTDRWPRQCQTILREHRAILETLADGDAPRARTLLTQHLDAKYLQPDSKPDT
ncbi:MAG: GntR family transcriptional regulator [Planctomycetota bacterium]